MKVYLTKYALSKGIVEAEAEKSPSGYFRIDGYYGVFSDRDVSMDKESAIQRAEEMRIAKLKSLDKQIKKISALKF